MSVSFTGNDTAILNDRVLNDLADGDCVMVTYPNELMNVKIGKNGNAIYGVNETGRLAEVKYRFLRGSADDKFMNGLLAQQKTSPETFVLITGELVKNIGQGGAGIVGDSTVLSGGVFIKQPEVKSNVEGDPGQAVTEYTLRFSTAPRVIS